MTKSGWVWATRMFPNRLGHISVGAIYHRACLAACGDKVESAWTKDPEHSPAVTRVVCSRAMPAQLGLAGLSPGVITSLLRSVAIPELGTQSPGHDELIAAVGMSRCSGPAER